MQSILTFENRGQMILAIAGGLSLTWLLYMAFLHPLRGVPGPFLAKFTELWRTYKYARGNWHKDILDLHERYGAVVRVSPNEVSFVDKSGLTTLFGHGKAARKSSWYDIWQLPGTSNSSFNATDPKEHSFLRKRVSGAYSMSSILSMEPKIQDVQNNLWAKFDGFAKRRDTIDMHNWASFFAFDVVGKLALGKPIGFLDSGKDIKQIIRSIHLGFYQASVLGYLPAAPHWVNHPFTQSFFSFLITSENKASPSSHEFAKWNADQVLGRMGETDGSPRSRDLLDHFIDMKEPDGSKANIPSVLAETGNIIGAGADTTSIGIRTVLAQLLLHEEDYLRVRTEVDEAYAKGLVPGPIGIPYLVAEKLTFLGACVKEALRLHPSILWQLPRKVPANGVQIGGYYIPSGMEVSMSPIAQNRCKEVFGPDANEWNPHRWIPSEKRTEAEIREMEKYNVTFGYGARVCIGRNLALVEIYKFIADFVRRYDAEFANKERPYVIKSQWFSYQSQMHVKMSLRELS